MTETKRGQRMNRAVRAARPLVFTALLGLGSAASAQLVDISECAAVEDRLARFDCYETLAQQAGQQEQAEQQSRLQQEQDRQQVLESRSEEVVSSRSAPQPQQTVPAQNSRQNAAAAEQAAQRVENFGLAEGEGGGQVQQEEEGEVLYSRVDAVREVRPNHWLVTLENGQVWQQVVGKRYNLRAGHEVRIYPTGWGRDYRMSAEQLAGFIQVRRIE